MGAIDPMFTINHDQWLQNHLQSKRQPVLDDIE